MNFKVPIVSKILITAYTVAIVQRVSDIQAKLEEGLDDDFNKLRSSS